MLVKCCFKEKNFSQAQVEICGVEDFADIPIVQIWNLNKLFLQYCPKMSLLKNFPTRDRVDGVAKSIYHVWRGAKKRLPGEVCEVADKSPSRSLLSPTHVFISHDLRAKIKVNPHFVIPEFI